MMVAAGRDNVDLQGLDRAGGIIAPIIPPSIGFVVFGVAGGVSDLRPKLFMAGIFPGVWLALALSSHLVVVGAQRGHQMIFKKSTSEVLEALRLAGWALFCLDHWCLA
jgi:TRAP-type C4-dicarboxylate transport system permease large subunit